MRQSLLDNDKLLSPHTVIKVESNDKELINVGCNVDDTAHFTSSGPESRSALQNKFISHHVPNRLDGNMNKDQFIVDHQDYPGRYKVESDEITNVKEVTDFNIIKKAHDNFLNKKFLKWKEPGINFFKNDTIVNIL